MAQRRNMVSKHIPDSKTQEEKENEEISLVNVLNPGDRFSSGKTSLVTTLTTNYSQGGAHRANESTPV